VDHIHYVVNDPVPALLLLPAVLIFGPSTNQTILDILLGAVAVAASWRLCEILAVPRSTTYWLFAFAFAGTYLWWASALGDVWFVTQTSAFAFLMLCLLEMGGRSRGWVVGLTFALSVGSRFTEVMALPVIIYFVATGELRHASAPDGYDGRAALRGMWRVLGPIALAWVLYNQARWGVPWDSGHTIFYHQDPVGSPTGSPFGVQHLAYQLRSFVIQPPVRLGAWPWLMPRPSGMAVTFTKPGARPGIPGEASQKGGYCALGGNAAGRDSVATLLCQWIRSVWDAPRSRLRAISLRPHDLWPA
jgi:hypothetical protein